MSITQQQVETQIELTGKFEIVESNGHQVAIDKDDCDLGQYLYSVYCFDGVDGTMNKMYSTLNKAVAGVNRYFSSLHA